MKKGTLRWFLVLQVALLIYSTCSIFNKLASGEAFLSPRFILFYGGVIVVLGTYAILWQQVIKHMPMTTAYANKGIAVVWGMVFGALIFGETITPRQILGAAVVIAGVILYVLADREVTEK